MTKLPSSPVVRVLMLVREQATGGRCSVHVLRRRPSAAASPFTSLHSAPQRPVLSVRRWTAAYALGLEVAGRFGVMQYDEATTPSDWGDGRSEVKEEPAPRGVGGGHERRPSPQALGRHPQLQWFL